YGDWYGTPYRDWSALFISFCLNYAGADPNDTPGNTGAASMAEIWNNLDRFAPAGEYTPTAGDIVFFKDNTAGIVSEVHNATFYVIRGDADNAVCSATMSLADDSVCGWGLTDGKFKKNTRAPDDYLLDISDGPAVFIFEGSNALPQMNKFSLRVPRSTIDLITYLNANGGNYFFTLLDKNNQELPKDDAGNYVVQSDADYKLTISIYNPKGFVPGTYQYQIPNGLFVEGGEGLFILKDGTNVGEWTVTDEGLITLIFNENINNRTDITISATMGIVFSEQEDPIDFDGKITVTIENPKPDEFPTQLNKWGNQGAGDNPNAPDPTKIYWSLQILGNRDSDIVGSVLSDEVLSGEWLGDHRYTDSDIARGLKFGVSETDPQTGQEINWHSWVVPPDDPDLTWSETGWSYKIPATAVCQWCGEISLGNHGWNYMVEYTSTPVRTNFAGTMGYMNEVEIDNQITSGWAQFTQGEVQGTVGKTGAFISDASGGSFRWELQATIPGRQENEKGMYFWYLMDYMDLRDSDGNVIKYITNDAINATVTAEYNGTTVNVPRIEDATANDPFAWDIYWSADHGDGIYYGRQINLLSRCNCTEHSCQFFSNGRCGSEYWFEADNGYWYTNGYCQCWTPTENTTFTFTYQTDDMSIIEQYGGMGNKVRNEAVLYNKPNGTPEGVFVSSTQTAVNIPGLFKKELSHDFDGYTANYKITVNEGKLSLTDGAPLTIVDTMTQTLAYISGSLIITSEDADGNIATLKQGVDYIVDYDGTGGQTDEHGKPVHTLYIQILQPQPVMYLLDYDATLIIPETVTGGIKYSNSATITLWGDNLTAFSDEKVYADINIAAKNFKTELIKTSALTNEPLDGATFGLFNENDGLITTGVTDSDGKIHFETNVIEGIILREHTPYYMQEIKSPAGYLLDNTKHWFCFCNKTEGYCEICAKITADKEAVAIPYEQTGKILVSNQPISYNLPATGGTGVYPIICVSVIFIVTPLIYRFIQRRKQERRGVG
ncbi:MAG: prealbumin-like fold domain-containing protein, partial [Ruminococcus sp.]|nr:prealbumin-like fold domain-containing protein [Ruminococcus sp.]